MIVAGVLLVRRGLGGGIENAGICHTERSHYEVDEHLYGTTIRSFVAAFLRMTFEAAIDAGVTSPPCC